MNKIRIIDYRTKFKTYYGIDFSDEYDIHHIDLNHDNNEMDNLMLLPKTLHAKYHECLNATSFLGKDNFKRTINCRISGNEANNSSFARSWMLDMIQTLDECADWYDFKRYLDGEIPNIHNIKFERNQEKSTWQ